MHSIFCDLLFPTAPCTTAVSGKLLYASVTYSTHNGILVRGACLETCSMGAVESRKVVVVGEKHLQCLDHSPDQQLELSARGVLKDVILIDQDRNSSTVMAITDESEVWTKEMRPEEEESECVGIVTAVDPFVC